MLDLMMIVSIGEERRMSLVNVHHHLRLSFHASQLFHADDSFTWKILKHYLAKPLLRACLLWRLGESPPYLKLEVL